MVVFVRFMFVYVRLRPFMVIFRIIFLSVLKKCWEKALANGNFLQCFGNRV
uniref:Uncharacterized protein n=1 Tax=Strigamia maritima TaxID=126957 RepID=T1J9F5_STRMM